MARRLSIKGSAAATLPAALAAAVLVSAPYAGTTTSPLGDSHGAGKAGHHHHHGQPHHHRGDHSSHRNGH